jgi:NCAIR mutase (PurE)-related protein
VDAEKSLDPNVLRDLLERLAAGQLDVAAVYRRLQTLPFEELDFARIDHHRALRRGFAETVFGQGKTPEQIETIFARLAADGGNVLATRVAPDAAERVLRSFPQARYDECARTLTLRQQDAPLSRGVVGVVCAGTSDLPVAEEARITLDLMNQRTQTFYDVGVAGLHRLLSQAEALRKARVLVVVAGMEGALPSVVGGLVAAPIVAVPTSVGYGASFHGLAALLAMLNSCAPGVSVVNIDNGYGAGYHAALINRLGERIDDPAAERPRSGHNLHQPELNDGAPGNAPVGKMAAAHGRKKSASASPKKSASASRKKSAPHGRKKSAPKGRKKVAPGASPGKPARMIPKPRRGGRS